jgi:hypothetical protein
MAGSVAGIVTVGSIYRKTKPGEADSSVEWWQVIGRLRVLNCTMPVAPGIMDTWLFHPRRSGEVRDELTARAAGHAAHRRLLK